MTSNPNGTSTTEGPGARISARVGAIAGSATMAITNRASELRAAGRDVLSVRLEGSDRRTAYVPLANLAEVRLG